MKNPHAYFTTRNKTTYEVRKFSSEYLSTLGVLSSDTDSFP